MPVEEVYIQGMFMPGNIELPTDNWPPRCPSTSESNSTLLKYKNLKVISSSRDGWSPARIMAANAESWAWQEAAEREEDEESAAWANADEGPEPGATYEDVRIYTKLENGEYRYWGVQDLDETIEEFWARIDPDNTREYGEYGVTYPAIVTPASKNGIRKSAAGNIEVSDSEIDEQIQNISNSSTEERTVGMNFFGTRWPDKAQTISSVNSNTSALSTTKPVARGRPRKIQSGAVNPSSPNPAGLATSMREDPPKRKRGRPAKEKHLAKSQDLYKSHGSEKKPRRPKAEIQAKVTKAKPKNGRPMAPSCHKMHTRARGPAENLQSF